MKGACVDKGGCFRQQKKPIPVNFQENGLFRGVFQNKKENPPKKNKG